MKDRLQQYWRGRCVHMLNAYEMTQHKHYTVIPRYTSRRLTTFSRTRDSQINLLKPIGYVMHIL